MLQFRSQQEGSLEIALDTILDIQRLKKYFFIDQGYFKEKLINKAVDDVSFSVRNGEFFGLVGESGCGKSTLANVMLRLIEPTSGKITFEGEDILQMGHQNLKEIRRNIQVVFQDPYSSLNPRMKVLDIIGRGLEVHNLAVSKEDKKNQVVHWLERVGLGLNIWTVTSMSSAEVSSSASPLPGRSASIRNSSSWMNPPLPSMYPFRPRSATCSKI